MCVCLYVCTQCSSPIVHAYQTALLCYILCKTLCPERTFFFFQQKKPNQSTYGPLLVADNCKLFLISVACVFSVYVCVFLGLTVIFNFFSCNWVSKKQRVGYGEVSININQPMLHLLIHDVAAHVLAHRTLESLEESLQQNTGRWITT